MRPPARFVAAALSGLLWALVFSTHGAAWQALVGLIPLLLVLRSGSFGTGWLFGLVYWTASIHWIAPTLTRFGGLPVVVGWICLLLLAAYLALFTGAFAWVTHRLSPASSQVPESLALCAVPAAWVVAELAQGWLFTGFPWNPAAQAWTDLPGALPLAAWVGTSGVSWLVILVPVAAVSAIRSLRFSGLVAILAGVATLLAVADRWAVDGGREKTNAAINVALVQPNAELFTDWDRPRIEAQYRSTLDLVAAACKPGELVVLPESAAFPYSYSVHSRFAEDIDDLTHRGCSVLLNATRPHRGSTFNTALLVTADGAIASYDKVHLVPWGEFVPLKSVLPFMRQIARGASEFTAGAGLNALHWPAGELGVGICYDAIYPQQTRGLVASGAEILVHLTNDAWYGDTSAPRQLLRASRFRAAESGRWVLRAALTGISAVIDPAGAPEQRLALGTAGILRARVPLRGELTPYQRLPWLVPTLALMVLSFAMVARRQAARRGARTAAH